MRTHSIGAQWEALNEKRQKAASQQLAAQRAAAYQAVRAQAGGLPSLTSMDAALPACEPHYFQDPSKSRFYKSQNEVPELEAREDDICPPQYRRERAPLTLTPPASDGGSTQEYEGEEEERDGNELIARLQEEVVQNKLRIQRLESELESEKRNRNSLQAERHEAVDLQRRAAESEMRRLKMQVANLDQLLDGSVKRQKELECELDLCREESHELKRRLHEERDGYESEIRNREMRERMVRQQVEYEIRELRDGVGGQRRRDGYAGGIVEDEVRGAPVRERRHSRGMAGRAYVSIPKHGNRRALWMLS